MKFKPLSKFIILVILFSIFIPRSLAWAAGPGEGGRRIRLDDFPAGPYLIRAITSPTPPRVENLYVEIRVEDGQSGKIITDAQVRVTASSQDDPALVLELEAVHDIAPIPTEYAAHINVPRTGVWEIHIAIQGSEGYGEAFFLQRVSSSTSISAYLSIVAPIAGLAVLGLVFWRLQQQSTTRSLTQED
jgi:hypothetical protein